MLRRPLAASAAGRRATPDSGAASMPALPRRSWLSLLDRLGVAVGSPGLPDREVPVISASRAVQEYKKKGEKEKVGRISQLDSGCLSSQLAGWAMAKEKKETSS